MSAQKTNLEGLSEITGKNCAKEGFLAVWSMRFCRLEDDVEFWYPFIVSKDYIRSVNEQRLLLYLFDLGLMKMRDLAKIANFQK